MGLVLMTVGILLYPLLLPDQLQLVANNGLQVYHIKVSDPTNKTQDNEFTAATQKNPQKQSNVCWLLNKLK